MPTDPPTLLRPVGFITRDDDGTFRMVLRSEVEAEVTMRDLAAVYDPKAATPAAVRAGLLRQARTEFYRQAQRWLQEWPGW